jgi:hypothetical protein
LTTSVIGTPVALEGNWQLKNDRPCLPVDGAKDFPAAARTGIEQARTVRSESLALGASSVGKKRLLERSLGVFRLETGPGGAERRRRPASGESGHRGR